MGYNNNNKDWDLIQKMLEAEASGKAPRLFSSQRTLFGIPSELDRELAAYAQEQAVGRVEREQDGGSGESQVDEPVVRSGVQRVEHPLEPVFDAESRVLILGTMPSPKSRETGFYYNHPQNRFWPVMAQIFNEPLPTTNEEKRALALRHHVALWDVLASCVIDGAKDVSIAQCVPNDVAALLGRAPIRSIFCTGAKATDLYDRYCKDRTGLACVRLPSTSSANAAWSIDKLVDAYRCIVSFTLV